MQLTNKEYNKIKKGIDDIAGAEQKGQKLFPVDPKAGVDMSPTSKGVDRIDEKMELAAMTDADIDYSDVGEPGFRSSRRGSNS